MPANASSNEPQPVVLSLGSINADFQIRADRRPEQSETLIGREFLRAGGGKAANVAFLARKLGTRALLFGRVGDDDLAEQALSSLRKADIDLSGVHRVQDGATAVSFITVPPDGKKGIILAPNANESWTDADIRNLEEAIGDAPRGAVLVLDCEVPVEVAEAAALAAGRRRLTRVLDPSPADRVSGRLLANVDLVTPNPSEARQITGTEVKDPASALKAARQILERGPKVVLAKLPDGGCLVVTSERATQITGAKVEVVDTTGAGDAFAGALAVGLAEGREVAEAARMAVAAADHTVTGYGSQAAYPDRTELDGRLGATTATDLPDDEG